MKRQDINERTVMCALYMNHKSSRENLKREKKITEDL